MSAPEPAPRMIVFDGHCYLCSGWMRFVRQRVRERPFELLPMQSERGRRVLATHGIDPDDPVTFLVLDEGQVLTESAAAIHVLRAVGGAWHLAVVLRLLPARWRDAAYRGVARNRYRWFGRRATCDVPPSSGTV